MKKTKIQHEKVRKAKKKIDLFTFEDLKETENSLNYVYFSIF